MSSRVGLERYGFMAACQGSAVGAVQIAEAIGRLKTGPRAGGLARTARALGICLGN
jgi:hypothetical protein